MKKNGEKEKGRGETEKAGVTTRRLECAVNIDMAGAVLHAACQGTCAALKGAWLHRHSFHTGGRPDMWSVGTQALGAEPWKGSWWESWRQAGLAKEG